MENKRLLGLKYWVVNISVIIILLVIWLSISLSSSYLTYAFFLLALMGIVIYRHKKKIFGPPYFLIRRLRELPEYQKYINRESRIDIRTLFYIVGLIYLLVNLLLKKPMPIEITSTIKTRIVVALVVLGVVNIDMILQDFYFNRQEIKQ